LSKLIFYPAPAVISFINLIGWGVVVAVGMDVLIAWLHPNVVIKWIMGFALAAYVAIPNYGLLQESSIPDDKQMRHMNDFLATTGHLMWLWKSLCDCDPSQRSGRLFIVKFGSTAIIQQEKGRIFQSMETYVQRLAIYNRGAGIPIDMLMDATLVIQFGQRLFVWEGSRFYIKEMEPQQDGRVVFYPQLGGLTDTRVVFCS
jgi:hypothetical protein